MTCHIEYKRKCGHQPFRCCIQIRQGGLQFFNVAGVLPKVVVLYIVHSKGVSQRVKVFCACILQLCVSTLFENTDKT